MITFEVRDLVVQYNDSSVRALDKVSLQIERGAMTLILGQNGSGKSTLLRCLAGLQNWKSGEVYLKGQSRELDREDFNAGLQLVAEDLMLPAYGLSSVADIYRDAWPAFDQGLFERVLGFGDIKISSRPESLSRGQKILAQFALALATQPEIILIDEVTATLDPYVRRLVVAELQDLRAKSGMTVVLATNIATEVNHIECNLILLRAGQIVEHGSVRELASQFQKVMISSDLALKADPENLVQVGAQADGQMIFVARGSVSIPAGLSARVDKRAITTEEIFVYLSDRRVK